MSNAVRYLEGPRQTELFGAFQPILSPVDYRKLQRGWQNLFRCATLKLLPAKTLAEHFDPEMGRPTKELYSMAGLLFIMEFRDWTHEEAADASMFNVDGCLFWGALAHRTGRVGEVYSITWTNLNLDIGLHEEIGCRDFHSRRDSTFGQPATADSTGNGRGGQ